MKVIIDDQLLTVEQARQVLFDLPRLKAKSLKPPDITRTKEYRQFRLDVLSRDEFTCTSCEQTGGRLEVHHIKKKSKFPEIACDVDNGVTLCYECHLQLHGGSWDWIYQ